MRVHADLCGVVGSTATRSVAAACLLAGMAKGAADGAQTVCPLEQTELNPPSFCYLQKPASQTKPENAGAMPAFANGKVAFMELSLGDGAPRLLAVEQLARGEKTGFRVYLDSDGDLSLADETPCETAVDPKLPYRYLQYTPPLTVPVTYRLPSGEVEHNCRFRLGFYPVPPGQKGLEDRLFYYAQFVALQGWTGSVAFGGKTMRLTLFDGDGDGKTEARGAVPRDQLRLESAAADPSLRLSQCLTRCVEIDGILYKLDVRPDGAEVAVSRYTDAPATVAWSVSDGAGKPAELSRLWFVGENLSVVNDGESAIPGSRVIPPGKYYFNYSIGKEAKKGYFRASKPVDIRAGANGPIECGGPVGLTVNVSQQKGQDETTLRVDISAANAAGHAFQVSGADHAGKVEILGPDGVPRGTGNMEYG